MAAMQPPPVQVPAQRRLGLIKLRIGAALTVRGADGQARQFTTRDKRRHPDVKAACRCFNCGVTYPSEKALIAAHPETAIMVRQQEVHLYAWWSDEPSDKDDASNAGKVLGLLSDEE